jgi:hypothetical protein
VKGVGKGKGGEKGKEKRRGQRGRDMRGMGSGGGEYGKKGKGTGGVRKGEQRRNGSLSLDSGADYGYSCFFIVSKSPVILASIIPLQFGAIIPFHATT